MNSRLMKLLVLALLSISVAKAEDNFLLGTWKINIPQSKAQDGSPLTDMVSRVDRYEPYGKDGIKYTSEETTTDGKSRKTTYSAQFDGKFYRMEGSPAAGDHVSLKRIDAYHTESRFQRDGKDTGAVSTREVSKDGRKMIYKGGRGTLIFDKQ